MAEHTPNGVADLQTVTAKSASGAFLSLLALVLLTLFTVKNISGGGDHLLEPELPEAQLNSASVVKEEPLDAAASEDTCEELVVRVSRTGKFDGAKLRATPGFEHEQAGIVTRGAHLVVCEKVETPGLKIPNVWYRILEGKHKGLWIHKQVLDF